MSRSRKTSTFSLGQTTTLTLSGRRKSTQLAATICKAASEVEDGPKLACRSQRWSALYSWALVVAMIIVHHDPPSTIPARLLLRDCGSSLAVACIPDGRCMFRNATSRLFPTTPLNDVQKQPTQAAISQPASVCTSRRAAVCCTAPPHLHPGAFC
jgi:hypothetical protein